MKVRRRGSSRPKDSKWLDNIENKSDVAALKLQKYQLMVNPTNQTDSK
jgi:hypothetical protein